MIFNQKARLINIDLKLLYYVHLQMLDLEEARSARTHIPTVRRT